MAFIDGDDFISGSIFSYQQANRMKNHFRLASAPSNPSEGMLWSDSDDDKLKHFGADSLGWDELLQATRSFDTTPIFDNLILDQDEDVLSDPPTDAELDGIFGTPATVGQGFVGFVQDSTSGLRTYLIYSDGTSWYYIAFDIAV